MAVAAILRGDEVLIARRADHAHQGGLLEFPGGKVEPGETVQAALVREIDEETGLKVAEASLQPVIEIRHDYGDKRVLLDVWSATEVIGEPEGREGQPVGWQAIASLRDEDFPAANRPIIRALRLPHRYAITGQFEDVGDGLARLERQLARHRPSLVLVRAPWLDDRSYEGFAEAAVGLCRAAGSQALLHGRRTEVERLGAEGLHLPWREAADLTSRPVSGRHWFGVSCHNHQELAHAASLGADFVTLGPVQPTASHPGTPPLGWEGFRQLVASAPCPVFALGGMINDDLARARHSGGQGIAGIGNWW